MAEGGGSIPGAETSKKGFYVVPKKDCQHVLPVVSGNQKVGIDVNEKCSACSKVGENWLCLSCGSVFCSRYENEHMVMHNQETGHPIAISYADISIWCYSCDSYIESPMLLPVSQKVTLEKFK